SPNSFLVPPSQAVVTITNVLAGISFSSLSYNVSKCGVQATVTATRTGLTNVAASVDFATGSGGSAVLGSHYLATNGTLTFAPGQTTASFGVTVINDHVLGPDHTVNLNLSNPVGAQLLNPSSAQLTIQECNGSFVVPAGTAFVTGDILPNTAVFYSNETVTVLLALRDIAGANTIDLKASLQQTNGVITNGVSGGVATQDYGVLIKGGPAVSRPFIFKVVGTNGQNIIATLALQDGTNQALASFGFTLGGVTTSYSNTTLITIKDTNAASPYPSTITVGNVVGNISKVTATLNNFNHTYASDVNVVLQGPGGQSILMSHAGHGISVSHANLTFDQSAASFLPESSPYSSGTYLPTAYSDSTVGPMPPLPSGGPAGPYNADLSTFVGTLANGNWNLWIFDDKALDHGAISNGWTLNLSVGSVVPENSDLEVTVNSSPVAPTTNNVLTYTIGVTNYGPAGATNVVISDFLAPSVAYVTNSFSGAVNTNGPLTFSVPVLQVGAGVAFTVTVVPTAIGYTTNAVTAVADQPSVNANSSITNFVFVGVPSADLGVSIVPSANPVMVGAFVNYVITLTNSGPSTAAAATVVNNLPVGFKLISASPSVGVIVTNASTVTWTVPSLNANAAVSLTVTLEATAAGSPLNNVSVTSSVYDPAKANNFDSAKTEVDAPSLSFGLVGGALNLNWAGASSYWLEGATNLPPPGTWVQLTTPGGATSYTLSPTNIYHFFRLRSQLP
ncbi:MAG TPA: Calx-beta domain-containing protein, partial [Verrucomicrobiae bacterium]|nr:Calx-beta domain-containing protein [Verrucomicrobiae bacterium]